MFPALYQRIAVTQNPPGAPAGVADRGDEVGRHLAARFAIVRPMLTTLSAITPRPTQRCMPKKPL
jgi:hypothetical protein